MKDYQLWLDYRQGKIDRELTKEEREEIRTSELAIDFLLSDESLIQACGGIEIVESIIKSENGSIFPHVDWLSHAFRVPKEVVIVRMILLVDRYEHLKSIGQPVKPKVKYQIKLEKAKE